MNISFEIDVSANDQTALMQSLGCGEDTFQTILERHSKAALTEYLECYLGRRIFTRGSDIHEYRLSLLIQHALEEKVPNDALVSRLFQKTLSASRTLIRNTLSKYRYQLLSATDQSAKQLLESATWHSNEIYHIQMNSKNMVDFLNQRLAAEDLSKAPVTRLSDSVGTYSVELDVYQLLCKAFGAEAVDHE